MSRNTYTLFHYVHSFYLLCFFSCHSNILFFFFFQAEDGIRDHCVTGVQTCALPISPAGAPNVVLAAGGTQLHGIFNDDGIYAWRFSVDWSDPANSRLTGPEKIAVAPYHYLCDGQLTT